MVPTLGMNVPVLGMMWGCESLTVPTLGTIIPNMGTKLNHSIGNALFSGVLRRIIGLLFGNPDRQFFVNEIARLALTGRGALQRELTKLTASGLVTMAESGRQKYYQANKNSPIFHELSAIVAKTFGLADVLRDALAGVAPDIRYAFIYGSVAKEGDTAGSDIDLMVISQALTYSSLFEVLAKTEAGLGRKISPTLYTPAEFNKRIAEANHFVTRVLEQPRIDLIGGIDDVVPGSPEEPRENGHAQGGADQPTGN